MVGVFVIVGVRVGVLVIVGVFVIVGVGVSTCVVSRKSNWRSVATIVVLINTPIAPTSVKSAPDPAWVTKP